MHFARGLATVIAVAAAAAAGLAFTGAIPALAATRPSVFILGPTAARSGCEVELLSARVSGSTPADTFAVVGSAHPGHTCTTFVERSVTGKDQWARASAKVALPSVAGLTGFASTGLVYDGPGYKARACVRVAGSTAVYCTSALSLAKGTGTASNPALAPSYSRRMAIVNRAATGSSGTPGACGGELASSTTTKKAGTAVVGVLLSLADPCTAWIQSRVDGGKTWTTVSPVMSYQGPSFPGEAAAFTAHYADNPGHLARICVKDMTSKKENCSGSW